MGNNQEKQKLLDEAVRRAEQLLIPDAQFGRALHRFADLAGSTEQHQKNALIAFRWVLETVIGRNA